LRGKRVLPACAIGNFAPFHVALQKATGGSLTTPVVRKDHDPFTDATVREIIELARRGRVQAIVVTEKDWSKLLRVPADQWPCPVVRPRLELSFDRGWEALRDLVLAAAAVRHAD
jgi:tetraacyldisaccharide-1-P 4'-kinase